MDRKKELIFKYFDMTYKGYKKHGRRPVRMPYPNVLFEYKNDDGRIAFDYNTESEAMRFDIDDFNATKNMFGVYTDDLTRICKEYIFDKFDEPKSPYVTLFLRRLN